ncbi:MAG: DUF502 domain-containing protein [Thermoguttaceae bacterium]|nr:DUF502 domain-containing protein [Thermoguttaceae bacterium]MDW8039304.1 DUF502 domain-containing protein [Thermoguttaceae bacterium]
MSQVTGDSPNLLSPGTKHSPSPFRTAVLSGLSTLLPPLVTVVILLWAWSTINDYLLKPVSSTARRAVAWMIKDIRTEQQVPEPGASRVTIDNREYCRVEDHTYIPREVWEYVRARQRPEPLPETGLGYYHRYVDLRYLRPWVVVPTFLVGFVLFLYLLGKLFTARIGSFLYSYFERIVLRLPLIRNVYGAAKQVSDFFFGQRSVEFKRVVAVEYPRKGVWSIGFVTGEGFLDVQAAANEPVLSVLVPTSPAPMTGFTVLVRRSEVVDLNITVEQAIEYIISCGVVVPLHQKPQLLSPEEQKRFRKPASLEEAPSVASVGSSGPNPHPSKKTP